MPLEAQTRLLRVLQQGEYTDGRRQRADQDQCAHHRRHPPRPAPADQPGPVPRGPVLPAQRRAAAPAAAARAAAKTFPTWSAISSPQAVKEGLPRKEHRRRDAIERLQQHRWPGNVRELENLLRRLVAIEIEDTIIAAAVERELAIRRRSAWRRCTRRLGRACRSSWRTTCRATSPASAGLPPAGLYDRILADIEPPLLRAALAATDGQPDAGRGSARHQPQHAAGQDARPESSRDARGLCVRCGAASTVANLPHLLLISVQQVAH